MHHLLIVDDQRDIHLLLEYYFTANGYAVTTASSGPEACELALARDFDLALVDWQMPDMDGVEVCRRLLANAEARHMNIGVWLMTGAETNLVEAAASAAGARAVLSKPVNPARVIALFDEYLNSLHHPLPTAGIATVERPKQGASLPK